MFNLDDIFRGYSNEDDYTARDLIILEILMDKGIVTAKEINERYSHLADKIEEIKKQRKEINEKRLEELKAEKEKLEKEGVISDKPGC